MKTCSIYHSKYFKLITDVDIILRVLIWLRTNIIFLSVFALFACSSSEKDTLFKHISSSRSGLDFKNELLISDSINGITFEYLYNGGGLAVGDLNCDGLKDVFFCGNMVSSKMYLNKGDLKFSDVTNASGLTTDNWCTGVSIVDINDDGLKDIYICVAGLEDGESRKNKFFINQGNDTKGVPLFIDMAAEMGLDDNGYSTMAVFFDYDKDEDMDVYLLTNSMEGVMRNSIKPILVNGEAKSTDRLYRNEGGGKFRNVSREAGILIEGYGLGIAQCDINQDGWTDIYCSNDFISNDLLWINNQDGTFTESAGKYFKHTSNNGMGMDIADFNNDGLIDVITLDMLPVSNLRQKLMFAFRNIKSFSKALSYGYIPQFVRNTLHLNQNKFSDGEYRFSEIGYMAGIYQTDWSWAPLFADFDNDGWKDLLVTNGFRKDITNLDFWEEVKRKSRLGTQELKQELMVLEIKNLQDVKLPNYIFKNDGNLEMSDKSSEWGLVHPTFTNGTAYADLDNDGDLDIILNNIDQEVTLYENRITDKNDIGASFLSVGFQESVRDHEKIGLKLWVYHTDNHQYFEYTPYRGYKSTVDPDIHIGMGKSERIDSLIIQWNDGTVQKIYNQPANQIIALAKEGEKNPLSSIISSFWESESETYFENVTAELQIDHKHDNYSSDDFLITPSVLHSLSSYGPSISVGDINQDGMDDFFVGSDTDQQSHLFIQNTNHTFSRKTTGLDSIHEDMGSLFFDSDNDGDLDLYVVSGGYIWSEGNMHYQDRLYINDGSGNFQLDTNALPEIKSSGSCVIAGDYDKDGDLDLFVGGRVSGRSYPIAPQSYLLENKEGIFVNRSELLGKSKGKLGMVTSAIWSDFDDDNAMDLILVGEWMPVTFLKNSNGAFINMTEANDFEESTGWWNSINGADLDLDGDTDYILGNYGLNSFFKSSKDKPIEIHVDDFDRNGRNDPIITHYIGDWPYIIHPYNIMLEMIPGMRNRFSTYTEYGSSTFNESFTENELSGATTLSCKNMESIVLENLGSGGFQVHKLPSEVQFSPVFGSIVAYLNSDDLPDIVLVGNSYSEETITGYYDASYGNVLINKGNFRWKVEAPSLTNFIADGDKKSMANIRIGDDNLILISENNGYLDAYKYQHPNTLKWVDMEWDDWYCTFNLDKGNQKSEIYYGSGFNSSSTRKIQVPQGALDICIYKYNGEKRMFTF